MYKSVFIPTLSDGAGGLVFETTRVVDKHIRNLSLKLSPIPSESAFACGPTHEPARMQIDLHGQIQPALSRPDASDLTCQFLVRLVVMEVPVEPIGRDIEVMVAVHCRFVFIVRKPFIRVKSPTRRRPTHNPISFLVPA